jgi:hypothetical protein
MFTVVVIPATLQYTTYANSFNDTLLVMLQAKKKKSALSFYTLLL